MVGHIPLKDVILVRLQVPQQSSFLCLKTEVREVG